MQILWFHIKFFLPYGWMENDLLCNIRSCFFTLFKMNLIVKIVKQLHLFCLVDFNAVLAKEWKGSLWEIIKSYISRKALNTKLMRDTLMRSIRDFICTLVHSLLLSLYRCCLWRDKRRKSFSDIKSIVFNVYANAMRCHFPPLYRKKL